MEITGMRTEIYSNQLKKQIGNEVLENTQRDEQKNVKTEKNNVHKADFFETSSKETLVLYNRRGIKNNQTNKADGDIKINFDGIGKSNISEIAKSYGVNKASRSRYKEFDPLFNQDTRKVFTIDFNSKLKDTEENLEKIRIINTTNGVDITNKLRFEVRGDSLKIQPPSTGYTMGQEYEIVIEPGLESSGGKIMKMGGKKRFTCALCAEYDKDYGKYDKQIAGLQGRLRRLSYDGRDGSDIEMTGRFDKDTEYAVNRFKERNGLGNDSDYRGVVGMQTWEVLVSNDAIENGLDLSWPTDSHRITSGFGDRMHPIYNKKMHHDGIDIGRLTGSNNEIRAAIGGKVKMAEYDNDRGWYVETEHRINDKEYSVIYQHLKRGSLNVKEGDIVGRGDAIAIMGESGASKGVHLHFEVQEDGNAINPAGILNDSSELWR